MLAQRPTIRTIPPREAVVSIPSCQAQGDCVMLRAAASCFGGLREGEHGRQVRNAGPSPLARCRHAEAGLCPPPAPAS